MTLAASSKGRSQRSRSRTLLLSFENSQSPYAASSEVGTTGSQTKSIPVGSSPSIRNRIQRLHTQSMDSVRVRPGDCFPSTVGTCLWGWIVDGSFHLRTCFGNQWHGKVAILRTTRLADAAQQAAAFDLRVTRVRRGLPLSSLITSQCMRRTSLARHVRH